MKISMAGLMSLGNKVEEVKKPEDEKKEGGDVEEIKVEPAKPKPPGIKISMAGLMGLANKVAPTKKPEENTEGPDENTE